MPPDPDRLVAIALQALDNAARLGDSGARQAAAMLRWQRRGGAINDSALLEEVAKLVEVSGKARGAVAVVARRHGATPGEVSAIERRLRRKVSDTSRPFP
jgi:hypothetical protein